jgi:acetyltransferase-like isoleucine patch superfamily enzyme
MSDKLHSIFTEPYRVLRKLRVLLESLLAIFPHFRFFPKTRNDQYPITLPVWFRQKVLGNNAPAYWPMHPSSMVSYPKNILIGKGVFPGYAPGCYLHGVNGIYIGDYTFIAPNVGIMSGNHDLSDLRFQTTGGPIRIGQYCWLGMNVVILPEVVLGDFTIVGAGAIVTHSFEEGYCVIAGNPAKVIRRLDKESCVRFSADIEYIGFIPVNKFEKFRSNYLNI